MNDPDRARLDELRNAACNNGPIRGQDAIWLLDQITTLEKTLATHKTAIATLEARDAAMLGLRNDLHERLDHAINVLKEIRAHSPADGESEEGARWIGHGTMIRVHTLLNLLTGKTTS